MAGIRLEGNLTGNVAEVNTRNELKVELTQDELTAGYVALASCSDDGGLIAGHVRTIRELDSTDDYRLRVGQDSIMFEENFSGTVINTSNWDSPIATSTVVQAGGFITLNSGASTTTAQGSLLRSKRHFPIMTTFPICLEFLFSINTISFNNALAEIGFGLIGTAPGTAAVDGAFIRITIVGISLVVTNNLNEYAEVQVPYADLTAQGITLTNGTHATIVMGEDSAVLWLNDIKAAKVNRPVSGSNLTAATQGHIFARQYNTGSNTLTALKLQIAKISVNATDLNYAKPWSHVMAGMGQIAQQYPSGGVVGKTLAYSSPTALVAQLTAPSATALGTGGTAGLGGVQRLGNSTNAVTLTGDTAYITHSFMNPLPVLTNPVVQGKQLYITGVNYSVISRGAIGPATPDGFVLEMNFGGTNVNPATAESATTPAKIARQHMLGVITMPTTVPIGTVLTPDIRQSFDTPICLSPGEFIQLSLRPMVTYVIAASQELMCVAGFTGYWE